jgi:predicted nucleotidyltransferase
MFKRTFVLYFCMLQKYSIIRVMHFFLSSPNKVFSLRGLANASNVSRVSAAETIEYLKSNKMIFLSVVGNTHQYKVNLESPLTKQWKILFNLEEIEKSKLVEEIIEKIPNVQSISLYGSLAKGTNDENSDLDLLVILEEKLISKPALGKKLAREPNIIFLTPNEWKGIAQKDKVFYDNVILDSIMLYGRKPVVL